MNDRIRNMKVSVLSDNWYTLHKVDFEYLSNDQVWERQSREAYDRGNGAVVLLYNLQRKSIILTRQFRMPTYLNKNKFGYSVVIHYR